MIQFGRRGEEFKVFLREILTLTGLKDVDPLLCDEGIALFDQAFTHRTVDVDRSYELYEYLGDVTVNKSIAWYLTSRFPRLSCPAGVKILTRLKSNLVSRKSLATFANELYFWEFVSASSEIKRMRMDKIIEDIFEAFIAVIEILADRYIQEGVGYIICYRLISALLNRRHISLNYNELFDAKTRIKEIFDYFGPRLGTLTYNVEFLEHKNHSATAILHAPTGNTVLGKGQALTKVDAEQIAAEQAIEALKTMGYEKPLSDEYKSLLGE